MYYGRVTHREHENQGGVNEFPHRLTDLIRRFGWDVGAGTTERFRRERLAKRRKERSDRSQAPNGSATRLRHFKAGTSTRGAERAQRGNRVTLAAWSACWFRRLCGHVGMVEPTLIAVVNQEANPHWANAQRLPNCAWAMPGNYKLTGSATEFLRFESGQCPCQQARGAWCECVRRWCSS